MGLFVTCLVQGLFFIYCKLFMYNKRLLGKSPFNGKTYNEVLAQNRAGTVLFNSPDYLRVNNEGIHFFYIIQLMTY